VREPVLGCRRLCCGRRILAVEQRVGAGQRGKVGGVLLGSPLGERESPVDDEADSRHDRYERNGEDDDDLPARGATLSGSGHWSSLSWSMGR
jgi:hypothetical protein